MYCNLVKEQLSFITQKINLLALALCAAFACFWMLFIAQWYHFRYTGGWDTAYFIQSLAGLAKGDFSPSLLDSHFLADHCHFIALLLAPLYWLFPDPLLLQNIKIFAFFSGAFVLFLILKKRLNPWMALGGMIAFCMAPANIAMLRFAFSYEALAIPLMFLIFKAFDDKKYGLYISCCVLLMMVKEQMPLVVMGFGMFAYMSRREDRLKWALIPFLMGLAVFIIEVFVLLPFIRTQMGVHEFVYWNRYMQFGKTPGEILNFLLMNPGRVWAECTSALNMKWYADLFSVWGGIALLSPQFFLPAIPLFFKMALSSEQVEHSVIAAYYGAVFTPFVFLAAWQTLSCIQHPWQKRIQGTALVLMLLHAFHYMPMWSRERQEPITNNILATQRFIDRIPPEASVLSGRKAMTYLANRQKLYAIKDYFKGNYYISGKKFVLPKDIDYALVDFTEFTDKGISSKVTAFNFDSRFKLAESIEDVALYVRSSSPLKGRPRLIERNVVSMLPASGKALFADGNLRLDKIEHPSVLARGQRIIPVRMFWQSITTTTFPYEIFFRLVEGDRTIYEKRKKVGSFIYPTSVWRKNEYVREDYYYLLPHLKKGKYTLEFEVTNGGVNGKQKQLSARYIIKKNLIIRD